MTWLRRSSRYDSVWKIFATLVTVTPIVLGQQVLIFGNNALPSCAQQCQLLQQAQAACVPPAAPVTQQSTYESCFCQSGYLETLTSDPQAVCGTVCQGSDLTQISTWYTSNCADGGINAVGPSSTTTTASTTTDPTNAASTTTSGLSNSNSGQADTTQAVSQNSGWWANHWKWVMMVIIILAMLVVFAVVAVVLRRLLRRRRDRVKGGFNDGITTRQISAAPPSSSYPYPQNVYNNGRATPSSLVAAARSQSRMASTSNLSRVSERGRSGYVQGGEMIQSESGDPLRGAVTPFAQPMSGQSVDRGKMRTVVGDHEIAPM